MDVVAIIKPVSGFTAPSSDQIVVGNAVDFRLYQVTKDDTYKPKVGVSVGVPVSAEVRNTEFVVGHLATPDATSLTVLADSKVSADGVEPRVVAGTTNSFSPFVAILPDTVKLDVGPKEKLPPCTRENLFRDNKVGTKHNFTYNGEKLLVKDERDDGNIDYQNVTPPQQPEVITAPDGKTDYIVELAYDKFGNEVSRTFDKDADGNVDDFQEKQHFFNASNQVTWTVTTKGTSKSTQFIQSFEYDTNGNITKQQSLDKNTLEPTYIQTNTFDENGNLVKSEIDRIQFNPTGPDDGVGAKDQDGLPDQIIVYAYDADGNQVSRTYQDKDGKPTQIDSFEYDEKGNLVKEIENRDAADHGGWPSPRVFTYTCWD